jgi:hypothetical protein
LATFLGRNLLTWARYETKSKLGKLPLKSGSFLKSILASVVMSFYMRSIDCLAPSVTFRSSVFIIWRVGYKLRLVI